MKTWHIAGWFTVLLFVCAGYCFGQETKPIKGQRTTWFKNAKWGVFTHYMADTVLSEPTVDTWNQTVNAFDVQGLAEQLKAIGAGYYIITLGQNSGFYCSPNATYDKYVGITPSSSWTRGSSRRLSTTSCRTAGAASPTCATPWPRTPAGRPSRCRRTACRAAR